MPYITAAFLRGAPYNLDATLYPDGDVDPQIIVWESMIDRATRQWFESRAAVVAVDGSNSDTLHFAIPLITVNDLFINDETVALDTDFYEAYTNRTGYPDDRRNPRIKLRRGRQGDIFTRDGRAGRKFLKGRRNQTIDGDWGFTEADGSVPPLIQRALALLVIEKITQPVLPAATSGVPPAVPTGLLIEEETDDHRQRWQPAGGATRARAGGLLGLTNNPEVLRILQLYKAPVGIATPADWTF